MTDAVVVSTARTPLAKAFRGAFNNTHSGTLGGHAIRHAVARAGIDPAEVDDVIFGCAVPEGDSGNNIARHAGLVGGIPQTAGAVTIARACSSGIQAASFAAQRIIVDRVPVVVAGGVESVSMVSPTPHIPRAGRAPWIRAHQPGMLLSMNETAEVVAERYVISREVQDAYAYSSQMRTAQAQRDGRFDDEIVPLPTRKLVTDRATGEVSELDVLLEQDECNRPDTTLETLAKLKPVVREDGTVTAGNASQLADGASASVLMNGTLAAQRGLPVLGLYRGFAIAGLAPDEMGIGPVYAIPKLLKQHGLRLEDIGLWELNEAYACQVVYCRDRLGIPDDRLNVDGGAVSIGHPFGMTGARQLGHVLIEGRRRKVKYVVVTMCIAGGMGAASLYELV
ncbi:acetyl-CoA C-acyltransferase [Sphingomonas sp. TDK1]|uniref:acetyl-CoA C-acyltransferase n=1 Tax=Sphingomonas sp. TDK1 TaxID=453247 RepID=UPI0007D8D2FE|nr:acetyl-CoA C-acyltransferase [Sphingomonas sp. TDK1]OAN65897.1 acetyl-CoA acetyltransferase [Sphingomonas sp. TDK1]